MANTLYDYYTGQGQALPSVSQRAGIYESSGLGKSGEYRGTADQNTRLLASLQGGSGAKTTTPTSTTTPTTQYPTSKEELPNYLATYQDQQFQTMSSPEIKVPEINIPTAEQLKTELTPTTPVPTTLDRNALTEKLRTQYGVADLEGELNTIKAEEKDIQAKLREVTGAEEGKPVALNVMAGRISEEERQARTKLDYIANQKSAVVDELTTKYNIINTYVTNAGLDYGDAVKAYEAEFDRNVKVQNLLSGFRQEAWTYATDAIKLNEQIKQNRVDTARANLTTVANAIKEGNLNMGDLPADQKLMIQKLEIQAGLPVGIIQAMKEKVDPKADIVFETSNDGITQIGFRNPDGTISVQSYGTRTTGKQTTAEKESEAVNQIKAAARAGESFKDIMAVYSGDVDSQTIYNSYNASSKWGPVQMGTDKTNNQYTKEELQALGIKFESSNQPVINIQK